MSILIEEDRITLEHVLKGITVVISKNPHFQYPQQLEDSRCNCTQKRGSQELVADNCDWHLDGDGSCLYYSEDGSPSCVIGHYANDVLEVDDSPSHLEGKAPEEFLAHHGVQVDEIALHFLKRLQSNQDSGLPWHKALDKAHKSAKSFEHKQWRRSHWGNAPEGFPS